MALFGSILGAVTGLIGANKAAKAQKSAANAATQEQRRQFDLVWDMTQKGRETYDLAQNKIQDIYFGGGINPQDVLAQTPEYQFQMQQGEQALNRQANAAGRKLSPAAMKDLMRFNSGLNASAYDRYMNRLFGMGNMANLAPAINAGQNMANNVSNIALRQGENEANRWGNINTVLQGTYRNLQNYNKMPSFSMNPGGATPTYNSTAINPQTGQGRLLGGF